jgi:hypothetical protein
MDSEKYHNSKFSIIKYSKTTGFVDLKDYKKTMARAKTKAIQEKKEAIKQKERMEKDLKLLKKLKEKETPLTKLQQEKLALLIEVYKDFI